MPTYRKKAPNGYEVIVRSTLVSQDIANNRSRIQTRMQISAPGTRAFTARSTGRCRSNSTELWSMTNTTYSLTNNQTRTLGTWERWVAHNTNGTKNVPVNGRFETVQKGQSWSFPRTEASGTHALPRIPRGPRVRHGGSWKNTISYVRHSGSWRIAIPYVRHGGSWRQAGR